MSKKKEPEPEHIPWLHGDNTGLRGRLSGRVVKSRPVAAELCAAVLEKEGEETVIDLRDEKP